MNKIKVWLAAAALTVAIVLVSLLWTLYNKNVLLVKNNKTLQSRIEDCQLDCGNNVIEKEMLYRDLQDLVKTVNSQTKIITSLTKQLKNNRVPIIIRFTTPCDHDALTPYSVSRRDMNSRGF